MRRGPKPAKSKEAKPPAGRKSPKNDGGKVRDLEKRLAEAQHREAEASKREAAAQEQQVATAAVLRTMRDSPSDVQPVFETILRRAVELCGARNGSLFRFDGELMHAAAHHNLPPDTLEILAQEFPAAPSPGTLSGRTILSRRVTAIEDVLMEANYESIAAQAGGFRSLLGVPLLSDGNPIGAIVIVRGDPGPFSDKQISLLQTFADQAVIAIENVRLFTELQEKNRALTEAHAQVTEALEQQTATSEILRVISSSPTDVQPVFDAIVESAVRLVSGQNSVLFRLIAGEAHVVAQSGLTGDSLTTFQSLYPGPLTGLLETAVVSRQPVHTADMLTDDRATDLGRRLAESQGHRAVLFVPLLQSEIVIGVLSVSKSAPRERPPLQRDEGSSRAADGDKRNSPSD
jgi:GAF domain-containing protein